MRPDIVGFLAAVYSPDSLEWGLQKFLIKQAGKGLSEHSVRHAYDSLRPVGKWLDGRPLSALTAGELKSYVDGLRLRYSPGTLRPVIGDIKQFVTWCKKKGLLEKNVAKRLKKPKKRPTQKSRPPQDSTVSAVAGLLTDCLGRVIYRDLFGNLVAEPGANWSHKEREAMRDLFVLVFLYETGGRAGELTSLGAVALDRAIAPGGAIFVITVYGKTDDEDIFFTRATAELWQLWKGVRPVDSDFAIYSMHPASIGRRMTTNGISQILVRRCEAAGVPVFRSHALRHGKGQRTRRAAGLEVASVLLGHANSTTTEGYANITTEEVKDAVLKTGFRLNLFGKSAPEKPADS